MTVVSIMSFGDSGAAIADEQLTADERKFTSKSSKIKLFNENMIFGPSGSSSFGGEVFEDLVGFLKKLERNDNTETTVIGNSKDLGTIAQKIQDIVNDDKKAIINQHLTATFGGLTLENLQQGITPGGAKLDADYKERVNKYLAENPDIKNEITLSIALGGFEKGKFQVYAMDSTGTLRKRDERGFVSIGAGRDAADMILGMYKKSLPAEKQENVPVAEGLVKLVQATNMARDFIQGVDIPIDIIYIHKDGTTREPNQEQCSLASELVYGLEWGYLRKPFVYKSVAALIVGDANHDVSEDEMKRKAGTKWLEFDRKLRKRRK